MDHRILIAAVAGLVLIALGAVYFAIGPSAVDTAASPAAIATVSPVRGRVTTADIEAEIARAGHAELQTLLKRNFANEYRELVEFAVRRRNEGTTDEALGEELNTRFQNIMRPNLKSAAGASMATIDKLAKNEVGLFHALGTDATAFCLAVLGKEPAPAAAAMPESIRRTMRLGTFYRFEAIVEGMTQNRPTDDLTPDDMSAFEAALVRNGMRFEDVRSGAFINQGANDPGKPCLMVEKLHTTIAGMPEQVRRKLYAGMYFLGRDK